MVDECLPQGIGGNIWYRDYLQRALRNGKVVFPPPGGHTCSCKCWDLKLRSKMTHDCFLLLQYWRMASLNLSISSSTSYRCLIRHMYSRDLLTLLECMSVHCSSKVNHQLEGMDDFMHHLPQWLQ